MEPLTKAAVRLQDRLANRVDAMPVVREYAARNMASGDASLILAVLPIIIQAMLGALTSCYPDSGFLAWLRRLFGGSPYAAMRAKAANLSESDRLRAWRLAEGVLRAYPDSRSDGMNPTDIVADAEAVAAEMTDEEFAELVASLKR